MIIVDPWKLIAHLFGPDRHGQESQWRIVETVIVFIRVILYALVKREVAAEESWPRISGRFVRGQSARLVQCLVAPVKSVYDVVLITDVPGVFPDPASELNTGQEQNENENSRENAKENSTSPGGNERMAEE